MLEALNRGSMCQRSHMVYFCWRDLAEFDIGTRQNPALPPQLWLTEVVLVQRRPAPAVSYKPGVTLTTVPCAVERYGSLGSGVIVVTAKTRGRS